MPSFAISDCVKYTPSQPSSAAMEVTATPMPPRTRTHTSSSGAAGAMPQSNSPSTSDERSEKSSVFLVREMDDLGRDPGVITATPSTVVVKTVRFWSNRNKLEKVLLCLLTTAVLSLLVLLTVFLLNFGNSLDFSKISTSCRSDKDAQVQVCTSETCVRAAANLLLTIDNTKDPCANFYDYACGNWNQHYTIPDDMSAYGTFAEVRVKVRRQLKVLLEQPVNKTESRAIRMAYEAYEKCLDVTTLDSLKSKHIIKIVKDFGGWPMLHGNWSLDAFDLTALMSKIRKEFALDIFFSLYVFADAKNTSYNILTVHQGTLGLGGSMRDYYLNDTIYGRQMEAYEKYIITIGKLLAEDEGIRLSSSFYDDVNTLIQFERSYASLISPDEQRRNHTLMYNRKPLRELKKLMPLIKWDRFFEHVMPAAVKDKFNDDELDVIVTDPEYLTKISTFLEVTDKRVITNYVFWRLIKSCTSLLDDRFDNAYQDLVYVMAGRQTRPSRWKVCVPTVVNWFEMATGALYIEAYFQQKDKEEALAMIANLREAFIDIVTALDWMDDQTKRIAIVKANAMLNHIGYPEFLTNLTSLDTYYDGLDITPEDSYFETGLKVCTWIQEQEFLDLLRPFNRNRFDTSPAVVNAFYSPEKNAIAFPAGILQPPFFSGDNLKAINYGSMGAVIGHEITHGFDDQGSQYDKDGNLRDWWTPKALERFRERTKCIIEQYNNYTVPEINVNVNGRLTQGENIADNAGVKEAYIAYRKYIADLGSEEPRLPGLTHITNDQIFFLSYANFWCGTKKPAAALQQVLTDPHSPELYRVIGVLSNLDEFANAFDCKPGTFMNPDAKTRRKCSVW